MIPSIVVSAEYVAAQPLATLKTLRSPATPLAPAPREQRDASQTLRGRFAASRGACETLRASRG